MDTQEGKISQLEGSMETIQTETQVEKKVWNKDEASLSELQDNIRKSKLGV